MAARNPTYFDGDLHTALLEIAEAEVAAHGSAGVSLRSVAKRAGVSHAAPAHHFGDKRGLFTALAKRGFAALSERMEEVLSGRGTSDPAERIQALGMAYIEFAQHHPGLFEVMWRPELQDRSDPALEDAARAMQNALTELITQAQHEGWSGRHDTRSLVILGWATVHGLAALWRDGQFDDASTADPAELSRAVMQTLSDALSA